MAFTQSNSAREQRGFSLVIVLIFLLVLLMIGIAGMQGASLQERMGAFSRDRAVSLQAAEIALRRAERAAKDHSVFEYVTDCTNGLCATGSAPDPFSYNWASPPSPRKTVDIALTAANGLATTLAQPPRYFVEFGGVAKCAGCGSGGIAPVFRSTVRATGMNVDTQVLLQSSFRPQ
ncbi:PilX N-terminal domain-containing pilus assembly protein [Niveibacterium sp. SC-1]|uniref:pilus assembly PilX family protein n=1 Tax=Niveibacterium sp. SC-1 TaxID=3135646 RepID=UPI00311F4448